ncbi:MAG: hypothetical protein WC533_03420 [Candidatus Pacearchaeota archaeon]
MADLFNKLNANYPSYDKKVDPKNPVTFEDFVDRETHWAIANLGYFEWDSDLRRFTGLSTSTYHHIRKQVAAEVAQFLDNRYKLSENRKLAEYLEQQGFLSRTDIA